MINVSCNGIYVWLISSKPNGIYRNVAGEMWRSSLAAASHRRYSKNKRWPHVNESSSPCQRRIQLGGTSKTMANLLQ